MAFFRACLHLLSLLSDQCPVRGACVAARIFSLMCGCLAGRAGGRRVPGGRPGRDGASTWDPNSTHQPQVFCTGWCAEFEFRGIALRGLHGTSLSYISPGVFARAAALSLRSGGASGPDRSRAGRRGADRPLQDDRRRRLRLDLRGRVLRHARR